MVQLWMPGAARLDIGDHAPTDQQYPPRAIAHITWDRNATAAKPADLVSYETLVNYFGRNPDGMAVAPHLLWDPFTGRITQFVPADSRSKSVADGAGGTRTNRAGRYVVQIEALFFPYCRVNGKTYPRLIDTPCLGWAALNAWTRSLGIPDSWPMGRPASFDANRSESVWESRGGWYGHSQVPENDHQDPGSWPAFTTQEDDMPTAQEIAAAVWARPMVSPVSGGTFSAETFVRYGDSNFDRLAKQIAATQAAITALAGLLGDQHAGVDTAEVVAAVRQAIADEVVKVDVSVHDQTT